MSLRNTQKPLRGLLSQRETAAVIVAVPAGTEPTSVITATYDAGLSSPIASNNARHIGVLSPIDGSSVQPVEVDASTVEYVTKDSLLKIGECANCSSDLYADNATADAMQEHAHFGACVMCGAGVSYANTGKLAQIATSVKRGDRSENEVANYFDFTELQTVDPNTVEENDMSGNQARRALRATIASAMRSINEQAAAEDDSVAVVPSDDEDFANSDDEDTSDLETMDMDESDPSEDVDDDEADDGSDADADVDDSDDSDEEASVKPEAVSKDNKEDAAVLEAPAEAPAAAAAPAEVTNEQPAEAAPVVTAQEESPAAAPAVVEEPAPAADIVTANDDTAIEYVATTPAQLSPDAELVPVSETAYYVVQDEAPVAVLRKENASAGAQSLWHKPVELRNAFRASLAGDREVAIANFGGKILTHTTNVAGVVAERIARSEQAAAVEIANQRQSLGAHLRVCLETAALGINKGMFGAQFANPVASELAAVLEVNGIREPKAIVTASMIQSMPKFIELVFAKATELAEQSDDALSATATMVGTADFVAPVTNIEAPAVEAPAAAPAPVTETASVAKPKYDIKRLT